MPSYDYRCHACGEPFEIVAGMNESRDNVACPQCQSADVVRVFSAVGTIGGTSPAVMPVGAASRGAAAGGHSCCGGHCH